MRWWERMFPGRVERGQAVDLNVELANYLTEQVGGTLAGASQAAPVRAAAAYVGRCFSTADILNVGPSIRTALSSAVLFRMGQRLILEGEAVFLLRTSPGRGLQLFPVDDYTVSGGFDDNTWSYRVTLVGPTETTELTTTRERMVHVQYVDLLRESRTFGQLVGRLEEHLRDESRTPRGTLIPVPDQGQSNETLLSNLSKMRGHLSLVKSMTGNWAGATNMTPPASHDWQVRRVGMNPPESIIRLQDQLHSQALQLFGISGGLFGESSGAAREAFRQVLVSLVIPLARLVTDELRARLDSPALELRFDKLRAADISSRTRSLKNLVEAGMSLERAVEVSGLGGN